MRGAIPFDHPASQQQSQDDAENQLFLFRQIIHASKVTQNPTTASLQAASCTAILIWPKVGLIIKGWWGERPREPERLLQLRLAWGTAPAPGAAGDALVAGPDARL